MPADPQSQSPTVSETITQLSDLLARMGGLTETQLAVATDALVKRDSRLARETIERDDELDSFEHAIEKKALELMSAGEGARPVMAESLAIIKIAADLERIGDLAKNIAKRALVLNQSPPFKSVQGVSRMIRQVQIQLKDVLDAFIARDGEKARAVWEYDEAIDDLNNSLFRELLTYMMENPRNITACTHLLFMAKNVERIGDHCTNIAEIVFALSTGISLGDDRPKTDDTSLTMVQTPGSAHNGDDQ